MCHRATLRHRCWCLKRCRLIPCPYLPSVSQEVDSPDSADSNSESESNDGKGSGAGTTTSSDLTDPCPYFTFSERRVMAYCAACWESRQEQREIGEGRVVR